MKLIQNSSVKICDCDEGTPTRYAYGKQVPFKSTSVHESKLVVGEKVAI